MNKSYKITVVRHDITNFSFLGIEFMFSHYYVEIRDFLRIDTTQDANGVISHTAVYASQPTVTIHGYAKDQSTLRATPVGNDDDILVFSVHKGSHPLANPKVVAETVISYEAGTPKDIDYDTWAYKQTKTQSKHLAADQIYQDIHDAQKTINDAELQYSNNGIRESQNSDTIFRSVMDLLGITEQKIGLDFANANNPGAERQILDSNGNINEDNAIKKRDPEEYFGRNGERCFVAGTEVMMSDGSRKPIQDVAIDDSVLAYDSECRNGQGSLLSRRVTRTYATPDKLVIDFHGLKVTPGHVFLCGDGEYVGQHRMLMEILRSDGTIVKADGTVLRAATNAPIGDREDAFVQVAYLTDANDALMQNGRMRAGTLILTAEGETKSVLQCLEAEGYRFDPESGLIAKEGEEPHPLYWYGEIPRPEDYVLKRSDLTDADLYAEPDYQPEVAAASRLGRGFTPAEGRLHTTAAKRAGETIH